MTRARRVLTLTALAALSLAGLPAAGAAPRADTEGAATLSIRDAVVLEGASTADVTFELDAPLPAPVKVRWAATGAERTQTGTLKLKAGTVAATERIRLDGKLDVATATALSIAVTAVDAPERVDLTVANRPATVLVLDDDAPLQEPEGFLVHDARQLYSVCVMAQVAATSGLDVVALPVVWTSTYFRDGVAALTPRGIAWAAGFPGFRMLQEPGFEATWFAGLKSYLQEPGAVAPVRMTVGFGVPGLPEPAWPVVLDALTRLVAAREAAGLSIPIETGVLADFVDLRPDGMAALAATGVDRVGFGTPGDDVETIQAYVGDELAAAAVTGLTVDLGFNVAPGAPGDPMTFGDQDPAELIAVAGELSAIYRNTIGGFAFDYASFFRWVTGSTFVP